MSAAPIRARLGQALEDQIARAGPNTSAVLRAYILLGIAATGVDMATFRRELARCRGEDLAPEIQAALASLAERPRGATIAPDESPAATLPAAGDDQDLAQLADPFLTGVEV